MSVPALKFSHVGVYAHDHVKLASFFERVLGFVETDRGHIPGRGDLIFLSRDSNEHHQIVIMSGRTADRDTKLINQISFRLDSLEALQAMHRLIQAEPEVSNISPINHGNAWAIYFLDPEGNRIEVFADTPWYVSQPKSDPIDLDRPAADIRAETEAICRDLPGFRSAESWRAELKAKIEARA